MFSPLLLIRLFQQTTSGGIKGHRSLRFLCIQLKIRQFDDRRVFAMRWKTRPPSCGKLRNVPGGSALSVLGLILGASYPFVWCGLALASEPQQSLEGSHRNPAAIMPKHELIEIHLQLLPAHPVVGSNEPLLHVSNGAIGQGHDRFCPFAEFDPQRLDARHVLVTSFFQPVEAL